MATSPIDIKLSAIKRERYFTRVRKRWRRRDVVEINESHPKFLFTQYIRCGIQKLLSSSSRAEVEQMDIFDDDYTEITNDEVQCDVNDTVMQFHSYSPKVFAYIRHMVGITLEEYMEVIAPTEEDACYLEFLSNSKSGQNFFLTNNKQLMIKTITKREVKFFLKILAKYIEHFQQYPHSLLVKFLGLHSVKIKMLSKPVHFMVMMSIFYPGERIHHRYDIKACEIGRYTKPSDDDDSNAVIILKEKNWENRALKLGAQREWFLKQIKADTDFLRKIGVLDYSLLVGIQSLHPDEIKQNSSLATVITRTHKSVLRGRSIAMPGFITSARNSYVPSPSAGHQSTSASDKEFCLPGMVADQEEGGVRSGSVISSTTVEADTGERKSSEFHSRPVVGNHVKCSPYAPSPSHGTSAENVLKQKTSQDIFCRFNNAVSDEEAVKQNRRLLPDYRNELHVIDGEERYYLGLIDFFTRYTLKKKLENFYKRILYPPLSFSTVPPEIFADRFCKFWDDHTE